ncbi:zinc finger CCCH domain-containing protein 22-like [Cucurbita pepo subsp. pepo]|uniref:zinc finger CCCH domain-containing protein 22-like n=1 Tax=Cucurbita pepo subsp. pepo TaxID=3664 RepID=UPI000C9D9B94|nr:zinc finger CCCH domain-containing protein 22-like [Cucurbita pepo subsp. pepo]
MANDEERVLEHQLEVQLHEQRESLAALQDALASDASNPELLEVHEELVQAIKDAEEGLLHLKRSRLLREADLVLCGRDSNAAEDVKVEPVHSTDVEPESPEDQSFVVGSKCRFRHTDGRWYDGEIVGLDGSNSAKISFLTPTTENMLICKFFLQQRCRFGTSCRLSHGVDIPLTSLRRYAPTIWNQSLAGSSIWALSSRNGIWRHAELESWDDALQIAQVVFKGDGSSQKLGPEDIALSVRAQISDGEESDSSLEKSDSSDYEDNDLQGLGFLESSTQQRGIQMETTIFAKWENHTRGIASKMMANMGYREGMGLGASGQGMLNPIPVKVLPAKQSLDHALESQKENNTNDENNGKKRSRGGKRKRDKKFAAAMQAAKEQEDSRPDVFNLINNHLAMHNGALNDGSVKKQKDKGSADGKKVDRRTLIAYDGEVKDLRVRIEKLEEMVNRNKNEKVVFEAALRKLNETRKALAEAEAAHASASNAVTSREKEKRWLKF